MKLFLSSQTNFVVSRLSKIAKLNPADTKVAFFTTAQIPFLDEYPTPKWVIDDKDGWLQEGYQITELCLNKLFPENLFETLKGFDIIHFCGGSSLYLRLSMALSGFDKIVHKLFDLGIIYSGSSAGSMVCCPDMNMKHILDDSLTADNTMSQLSTIFGDSLTGLNLVPFLLSPHFNSPDHIPYFRQMVEFMPRPNYPILFLADDQGLWVDGDSFRLI
jgi:dipeptidase E